jgi:hypothetical protein
MITTKMIQNDYKKIFVVKNEQRNDFVPLLYRICSNVKNKIVSELQRIYYKTTKIAVCPPAFFPLQQNQWHH